VKEGLLFLAHRIPFPPNKGDKIRSFICCGTSPRAMKSTSAPLSTIRTTGSTATP